MSEQLATLPIVLMARSVDEKGRRQPVTNWNYQRKHFDGIVPVDIEIE